MTITPATMYWITSYIDSGDGRYIRISNHEKKNGLPNGMINVVYDWKTGKINNEHTILY